MSASVSSSSLMSVIDDVALALGQVAITSPRRRRPRRRVRGWQVVVHRLVLVGQELERVVGPSRNTCASSERSLASMRAPISRMRSTCAELHASCATSSVVTWLPSPRRCVRAPGQPKEHLALQRPPTPTSVDCLSTCARTYARISSWVLMSETALGSKRDSLEEAMLPSSTSRHRMRTAIHERNAHDERRLQ